MGRPVMLGNGSLTVGLNEQGLVHDFYYPYVGLDNLTTARSVHHKIGIWVDGIFSWVDNGTWDINVDFETDALISKVHMQNDDLSIKISLSDFVDSQYNAFCRMITLTNQADNVREVRLFMHQVFQISRGGRADTALFVPDDNYILDYKGRCCLLIYGQDNKGTVYDQFAIGNYGIEGKEGTYVDAEDGELSGSAVEHGGVDSVLRFPCSLEGNSSVQLEYWIAAADSQYNAEIIHKILLQEGLEKRLQHSRRYWHEWLDIASNKLHGVDRQYLDPVKKSLMVIKAHTDKRGGVIASCDSSIYNYGRDYYSYVWPRDGAYAVWPLIRLGYTEEPKRFFEFCRDILTPDGYLMHKYQPDRAIGSTWHPLLHGNRKELAIQEDETAIVLYLLGEFYEFSKEQDFIRSLYDTFIRPAANFMSGFMDENTGLPHASYDLWEEKFLTNTYTVAVVYKSLKVAARFADEFEYPDDAARWREAADRIMGHAGTLFDEALGIYIKGLLTQQDGELYFDKTLDISSLYGVFMFGLHGSDTKPIHRTVASIESILLDQSPSGGSPRYVHDHYFESNPPFQGNPWHVTTLWLAQYYIRVQKNDKARSLINWSLAHAYTSGALSEQVNPADGSPISVMPLVWSHSELINTVLDLANLD